MNKDIFHPKLHMIVLAIVILCELIGTQKFVVGSGVILFLPMLYATILGASVTWRKLKLFSIKESEIASPIITVTMFFLIAKVSVIIGPNLSKIVEAGPAFFVQEFGNALKTFIALPIGLMLGLNRELIGATHSIDRELNVALISEKYGLDSPEGFGVLGVYIMGTLFGTVFLGLFATFIATVTSLHPYALAMACGVGSSSMMVASSGSLIQLFPQMEEQIIIYAGISNFLSVAAGMYLSIFIYLPITEWLYKKLWPILGRKS